MPDDARSAAPSKRTSRDRETMAALDLGSNSFHLVVARVDAEGVHVLDDRRVMVRLAEGLDASGRLERAVERRALACLDRFGATLRPLPRGAVRVVGTNALRKAKNAREFVRRAEALLGHPIDIVSGREEARLTYLGVASTDAPDKSEQRLLIDIGGGSTECILGVGTEVVQAHSLYMGCVSFTERHFDDGRLKSKSFESARRAARLELSPFADEWKKRFETAWGSSGTMRAIESILVQNGFSEQGITPQGVERLIDALVIKKNVRNVQLAGLAPERAPVIPGGVAIVAALLEAFGIERLRAARGAMREGILYDLIGRRADSDIREASIRSFADRHGVDRAQAERVQRAVLDLLKDVSQSWDLELAECVPYLRWAAMLHEIGQSLSYSGYHKHGAYLVRYASLAGLAREDAAIVSALVGLHRRSPDLALLDPLPTRMREKTVRMAALLRVAVALHRSRSAETCPVHAEATEHRLEVVLSSEWVQNHALALDELEQERKFLREMGIKMKVRTG
jgi:exopolyphosphatase/guanosine-5'-triphosphate,3'-diphosphate pyrophosphatase